MYNRRNRKRTSNGRAVELKFWLPFPTPSISFLFSYKSSFVSCIWDAFDAGFLFNQAMARGCQDHHDQELDSVILKGPFQFGGLNGFQGSLGISSSLCAAHGDPPHKHSCNPRQVPKTSLLAKCTLKLQRKRCSQFYYSQRELNMLLEQAA